VEVLEINFQQIQNFNKTSTKIPKLQQKYNKKITKLEGTPSPSRELQKQQ